jgi:purine-nucleoside phosphorylase
MGVSVKINHVKLRPRAGVYMIKSKVLGALAADYMKKLDPRQKAARVILGTLEVDDIVLLPVDRRLEKKLIKSGRRPKRRGYTTSVKTAGRRVSVVNSGLGAPAMEGITIACTGAGAKALIRIDSCGGLKPPMEVGQLFVAEKARAYDGATQAITEEREFDASPLLLDAVEKSLAGVKRAIRYHKGTVGTVDVFFGQTKAMLDRWAEGCQAIDMESSILYHLAARFGLHAVSVLVISDVKPAGVDPFGPGEHPLGDYLEGRDKLVRLAGEIVKNIPSDIPPLNTRL